MNIMKEKLKYKIDWVSLIKIKKNFRRKDEGKVVF